MRTCYWDLPAYDIKLMEIMILFSDAIEYLYEKKIPEIKNYKLDRYLPRIQYTNGNIEIFTEEKMNKQMINEVKK